MSRSPVGVVHGRFQILHRDHLEYILTAKPLCNLLIVGITSPDPTHTNPEPTDANRGEAHANPCTYYERMLMIDGALTEKGIPLSDFRVVPFPIGAPDLIRYYAPLDATYFLTIYDEWGEAKLARLEKLNLRTHVLWRRADKGLTASRVRHAIAEGYEWEHMVPAATARVVAQHAIAERIRSTIRSGDVVLGGARA
jgi:nicotinamide mononucleotide adenylyltransferase